MKLWMTILSQVLAFAISGLVLQLPPELVSLPAQHAMVIVLSFLQGLLAILAHNYTLEGDRCGPRN